MIYKHHFISYAPPKQIHFWAHSQIVRLKKIKFKAQDQDYEREGKRYHLNLSSNDDVGWRCAVITWMDAIFKRPDRRIYIAYLSVCTARTKYLHSLFASTEV